MKIVPYGVEILFCMQGSVFTDRDVRAALINKGFENVQLEIGRCPHPNPEARHCAGSQFGSPRTHHRSAKVAALAPVPFPAMPEPAGLTPSSARHTLMNNSAQHQHRCVRMRQHLGGLAAQQQALEPFAAVGGHHDQVAFVLFGG